MRARRAHHALALGALALSVVAACGRRRDAATPDQMKAGIAALQREREELRARVGDLVAKDRRLEGMPTSGVRVGVPTVLTRRLVERVVSGFVDQVTLRLSNLKVHKTGKVKKVVTLGEYTLDVRIDEVSGRLKTGKPEVHFGGNQITLALPVRIASGRGDATIDFDWDGKNVSGAVCGDMTITEEVSGGVKPEEYAVRGSVQLAATASQILASPRFPVIKVKLKVEPSAASWAAVQKILDDKGGVCGFVVDKVNIRGVLEDLVGKGFNVRLPTEKIKPMAIPVGIAPTMTVRGQPVTIGVRVSQLAITTDMIWLGADVSLGPPAAAAPRGERTAAAVRR
ncbi:MAG TPA: hypothetical protein VII13_16035 [Vicinamibacteria bacterium]